MCDNECCPSCGETIVDNECNCPPEDYIMPGSETFLYVNAYEVSRHYGGPEEGGWWYNNYSPLASIPVIATVVEGHDNICYNCARARENVIDGNKPEFCKWSYHLVAKDNAQVEMFKAHLENCYGDMREGSIYSVLGGTDINICVEDHPAKQSPETRPRYE